VIDVLGQHFGPDRVHGQIVRGENAVDLLDRIRVPSNPFFRKAARVPFSVPVSSSVAVSHQVARSSSVSSVSHRAMIQDRPESL
jgi:hypothetical protein